jgi:hypothetical protein
MEFSKNDPCSEAGFKGSGQGSNAVGDDCSTKSKDTDQDSLESGFFINSLQSKFAGALNVKPTQFGMFFTFMAGIRMTMGGGLTPD